MRKHGGGKDPPKVPGEGRSPAVNWVGLLERKRSSGLPGGGGGGLLSEAPSVERGQWFWLSSGVSAWDSPSR